jgi:hypothetical protein
MDAHAGRPPFGEAALRRDGEGFHTFDVLGAAGHMHLGGRDRRGHAAMQVAFEIAHRSLPRRVVAERYVDMGIDKAGNCRRSVRIDDDVGAVDQRAFHVPGRDEFPVLGYDRVAGHERVTPIAGNNRADIYDRYTHVGPFLTTRAL